MKIAFLSSCHIEDLQKLSFHLLHVEWQLFLNTSFNSAWSPSILMEIWHRVPRAAQQIQISKDQWLLVYLGDWARGPMMLLSWCLRKAHCRGLTFRSKARKEPSAREYFVSTHCVQNISTSILFFFHLLYTVSYVPLWIKQGNHIFGKQNSRACSLTWHLALL